MLHYVSDNPSHNDLKPWSISHNSYLRLLDFIVENKFNTISFEDVINDNYNKKKKNIIITFDDCPKQLFDFAIPELQKRNMKAVFYLPTAHIGGYNNWSVKDNLSKLDLMSEKEIVQLSKIGMEVGSHAHDHVMLSELSFEDVKYQLQESKRILTRIINKEILTIAYPYGDVPNEYRSIVREVGYKYGVSVYSMLQSDYSIRRWIYDDTDTVRSLRKKTSITYGFSRSANDKWNPLIKTVARKAYLSYKFLKSKVYN